MRSHSTMVTGRSSGCSSYCERDGAHRGQIIGAIAGAAGLCLAAFAKPPLFAIAVTGMGLMAITRRDARTALIGTLLLGADHVITLTHAAKREIETWPYLAGQAHAPPTQLCPPPHATPPR